MFLMVSSSCKHVVNGYKIEVIEPTTESTTGCVAFFMKGGRGGGRGGSVTTAVIRHRAFFTSA